VDYELTSLGHGVAERLMGLVDFVEGRMDEVLKARTRYDETRDGPATKPATAAESAGALTARP
jgi:hypothetical protein